MDQLDQPQEPTQVVPPAPPPPPEPAYPPSAYPPAMPREAPQGPGWPPPTPASRPAPPPPPGYPPAWAVPPEPIGPAPGVRFAAHGARLVAYVVDGILLSVIVTAVTIALALLTVGLAAIDAGLLAVLTGIVLIVAVFAVGLGYFPWFWVNGGATPGMRIFNLRLVRDRDGGPIGWGEAILRLIGMWLSAAVFYLGFAWILVDKRRRGWQDLIAGTVMIQPA